VRRRGAGGADAAAARRESEREQRERIAHVRVTGSASELEAAE
jgi:hypothetical protein